MSFVTSKEDHLSARSISPLACFTVLVAMLSAVFLAGCGQECGGSASCAPVSTDSSIVGTAAYGAPLSSATVTVTDSTGKSTTTVTNSTGLYLATVTGFTAPLLVSAIGTSGDAVRTYRALVATPVIAGGASVANATPLTEAIAALASSDGASPDEFADPAKLKALDVGKLKKASDAVAAIIKDIAADLGGTNFDPLTTLFVADSKSVGDKLLDTVKVSVASDTGVTLRNALVSATSTDPGTPAAAMVTIKDVATQTATALPKATTTIDGSAFDSWVSQVNKCLVLPPTSRVTTDTTGAPATFVGDCANITLFASSYKRNGFTLLQYWGNQFRNIIPAGAVFSKPEILGTVKNANSEDLAIVRLPYTSPKGNGSYIEVTRSVAGTWIVEGNQRNYDASIGTRILRTTDASTYELVPTLGPDAGRKVGKLDAYVGRIVLSFNQSGPNGANVYAVRVKGPGLPTPGVVLARSSSCGTGDFLAFYSNNGTLPAAPVAGSVFPLPTASTTNGYNLFTAPAGSRYTGTDFYNEWRGRSSTGGPSTSSANNTAPTSVSLAPILDLAAYTFEVFKAGAATDTFVARAVARPISAQDAAKLAWARFDATSLKYVDPTDTTKTGELTTATLGWSVPTNGAPVTSAYLFGQGNDTSSPPVSRRMNMGTAVQPLGDTSLALSATAESDGNGNSCVYDKVPPFNPTAGYREVGTRQSRVDGLVMQQYVFHIGRPVN